MIVNLRRSFFLFFFFLFRVCCGRVEGFDTVPMSCDFVMQAGYV